MRPIPAEQECAIALASTRKRAGPDHQADQQNKQKGKSPARQSFDAPLNTGSHDKGREQKADSLTGQSTVAPAESIKEHISGLLALG